MVAGACQSLGSTRGSMDPMQLPGGDPWMSSSQSGGHVDASARTPIARPLSFYPSPAWNNYRPSGVPVRMEETHNNLCLQATALDVLGCLV